MLNKPLVQMLMLPLTIHLLEIEVFLSSAVTVESNSSFIVDEQYGRMYELRGIVPKQLNFGQKKNVRVIQLRSMPAVLYGPSVVVCTSPERKVFFTCSTFCISV